VATESVRREPRRVVYRHYIEGEEVAAEQFYEAVRAAGGAARVQVFGLGPAAPRYVPTPAGRAALREQREEAGDAGAQ
jgi:hypothetical protein